MCGIAGYIARTPDAAALRRMTAKIAHRGPDGEGFDFRHVSGWHIGLGHRRLAIIDLEGGAQPEVDSTGNNVITYNGEVYNFRRLRSDLEARSRSFRTRCDTEVVLQQMVEKWTPGVSELDGMFAFAYWDGAKQSLLLARDRAGIKPLYYASTADGGIIFASELGALLEHPACSREIDPSALAWYFFADYIPPPRAILAGVRKLSPGFTVEWKDGQLGEPKCYWVPPPPTDHCPSDSVAVDAIRGLAADAVREQMVADVPLGVFLSGGLDSSTIAMFATQHSSTPINTFSIGFDNPDYDESDFARRVAAHIGSVHIERRISDAELLRWLPDALSAIDEPLADPSILPTFLVAQVAAEHVKVCLGGDGGDELFGGYPTLKAHRLAALYRKAPRGLRRILERRILPLLPNSDKRHNVIWKLDRFVSRFEDDAQRRHLRWMSNVDLPQIPDIVVGLGHPPQLDELRIASTSDLLNDMTRLDFQTYLPHSVLAKVDRASMALALEVRPPFLHAKLIDTALSMPSHLKYRGGVSKWVLKQAVRGLLPDDIIDRPKRGFGIPLQAWIRGPLAPRFEAILRDSPVWDRKLLAHDQFRQFFADHQQRRRDRAKPLWSLLVFDDWMRRVLG